MSIPIHNLSKTKLARMAKDTCEKHGHSYLEHYSCYQKEHPEEPEKIGFWDIEASGLVADYGQMLSWCIKDGQSNTIIQDWVTKEDVEAGIEDTRIVQSCIDNLMEFDKIVTYYGSGFDFPFLRARALIDGLEFPEYGTLDHKDLYFLIRSKFKLSSRRLENACRQLLGATEKTRIDSKYWRAAVRGDAKSIAYIVEHNEYDVLDLEKLYNKTIKFHKVGANSI